MNRLFLKKIAATFLGLCLLSLFLGVFYNLTKKKEVSSLVFAQEQLCYIDRPEGEDKIPIGEATDQTEAFAKRLLEDVQTTFNSSLSEINSTEKLVELTDENHCTVNNCSSRMEEEWNGCCDPYDCGWDEEVCDEEGNCEIVHHPVCCYGYCVSCQCKCEGDACPFDEIDNSFQIIEEKLNKIKTAFKDIKDLSEGNVLDEFKKSKILEKLIDARNKLDYCYTPSEYREEVIAGEFTPKIILSCEFAVDENILDQGECYGHEPDEYPERANNYYCCE